MSNNDKKLLVEYLSSFVSAQKWQKMQEVVSQRTNHITVVLENLYQDFNASAAFRSIECFGLQEVHLVETEAIRSVKPSISKGSEQWLTINAYRGNEAAQSCFARLKEQGYTLVATMPHKKSCSLYDLPLDNKTALVFGTEKSGVSPYIEKHVDSYITIPMYGFTQSFNVAASVAISLSDTTKRLRASSIDWQLSQEEHLDILYGWLKQTIRHAHLLEKRFYDQKYPPEG